jgi:ribosomal protein S18 acetylase RimI-like enzyme
LSNIIFYGIFAFMIASAFETLDLTSSGAHAAAAARLLTTECADRSNVKIEWDTDNPEENVKLFIKEFAHPLVVTYGLIEAPHGVIAAASVVHDLGEDYGTQISNLAVHPDMRRQRYGTRLIRHIAEQALAQGDVKLTYHTNYDYFDRADEKGFLDSLGFRERWEIDFEVLVAELLARDEP